jgi:transposase
MRFGVRGFDPTLRKAANRLEKLITPVRLPPLTLAEMLRDMSRLRFLREQIRSIEKARVIRLKDEATKRTNAMVHLIARIFGIEIETADTLVHEVLSRNLPLRRKLTTWQYQPFCGAVVRFTSFNHYLQRQWTIVRQHWRSPPNW